MAEITADIVSDALRYISADTSRDEWTQVLMSIKSFLSEAGKNIAEAWSRTSQRFKKSDFDSTWRSINEFGGITIGTLLKKALDNGYSFPKDEKNKDHTKEYKSLLKQYEEAGRLHALEEQRQKEERQKQAAETAKKIIQDAGECLNHPYLEKKQVQSHGLLLNGNNLLIPVYDAGTDEIISYQTIYPASDGFQKRFLKDGKVKNGYFSIGDFKKSDQTVAFAEGYATAATIHEITGWTVIVCFSCGNLAGVVKNLQTRYGYNKIVICADNDEAGQKEADKAAKIVNARVLTPVFPPDVEGTDFNDLFVLYGKEVVSTQLQEPDTTAAAVVDVSKFPYLNEKKKPLNVIENLEFLLKSIGCRIRYNEMTHSIDYEWKGHNFSNENKLNCIYASIVSECAKFGMPYGNVSDYLQPISDKDRFHPARDWIDSTVWDEKSRRRELLNTVHIKKDTIITLSDGSIFQESLLFKHFVYSVACLYDEVAPLGLIIFYGDQGIGKTEWIKHLAPPQFIKTGVFVSEDKDTLIKATSCWIVEIGEIDGSIRKSDQAKLKAFITSDKDEYRKPYAKEAQSNTRRTPLYGTTNENDFLKESVDRRSWVIAVSRMDAFHNIDMAQFWAEMKHYYFYDENGRERTFEERVKLFQLTEEEKRCLKTNNENYEQQDAVKDMIDSLPWDEPNAKYFYLTASEILCWHSMPETDLNIKRVSKYLKAYKVKTGEGRLRRSKLVPLRVEGLKTSITLKGKTHQAYTREGKGG